MIDFAEKARIVQEGHARVDAILAQRNDIIGQNQVVNQIDDLNVAKEVIKQLLDKMRGLERNVKDLKATQEKTVDSIVADATARAGGTAGKNREAENELT